VALPLIALTSPPLPLLTGDYLNTSAHPLVLLLFSFLLFLSRLQCICFRFLVSLLHPLSASFHWPLLYPRPLPWRLADPLSMELDRLDFNLGLRLQEDIWRRFHVPVTFVEGKGLKEFFLVVAVGRCKFKLTESSVATLL
jgi:hypothetical protein